MRRKPTSMLTYRVKRKSQYLASDAMQPIRGQVAYISNQEIADNMAGWAKKFKHKSVDEGERAPAFSTHLAMGTSEDGEDPMYEQAKEVVIRTGRASTSLLQRRLGIGYGRAARLLESLEENGVVGPADGSKPRKVIKHEAALS